MVYEHLSRLYHRDEVRWKEEYERRSSSPMTRRFDFILQEYGRTQAYPAFAAIRRSWLFCRRRSGGISPYSLDGFPV